MTKTTTKKATKTASKKATKVAAIDVPANGNATPAKKDKTPAKIAEAKGRPMLHWVGKKPIDSVRSYPAQLIETFSFDSKSQTEPNLLFHGDNKEVLAYLLTSGYRGEVNLIYIDPPFDSKADYVRQVELRGVKNEASLTSEGQSIIEQVQYTDIWAKDTYLQFMYERLMLLKELLAGDGFIILHCNVERSAHLRLILEEVFTSNGFKNTVVVEKSMGKSLNVKEISTSLNSMYDVLLVASNNPKAVFKTPQLDFAAVERTMGDFESLSLSQKLAQYWKKDDEAEVDAGGKYYWAPFEAQGTRRRQMYELFGLRPIKGRCWMWEESRGLASVERYKEGELLKETISDSQELGQRLLNLARQGVVHNPGDGKPKYKIYIKDFRYAGDLWSDVGVNDRSEDYPTAKSPRLLSRIIDAFSNSGDLVLDCFIGSGTTAAVAQRLGRRWIGCDINKGAIQYTSKRLQNVISEQANKSRQGRLTLAGTGESKAAGAALAFNHYRINDYDLQVQHNEALEIALEHIGVTRTRTDSFFEGVLGKKLVKVVPLVHPCTLLDIELVDTELKTRPDEDRNVVMVALGKDANVDAHLVARNKKHPVNKIELIELRTDSKYGNFFTHQSAWAKVSFKREGKKLNVTIEDFSSPTILQRLSMDETIFKERITDFRSMIDVVLLDTDYNGEVFNIHFSDVPEKKTDLVKGNYQLDIASGKRTVAVKVIDMLGEEVIIMKEV